MKKTRIIAEAGVNHNGHLALAMELIDAAADAGADMIKFQTFSANALVTKEASLAEYQKAQLGSEESQFEMLSRLELSQNDHLELIAQCERRDIAFLSTPFDLGSLSFLINELGQTIIKVGSGDLNNAPLLLALARSGVEIILSTGMSNLSEIEQSLGLLAFGFDGNATHNPTRDEMALAWADPERRSRLEDKVTLLHCVSNYPASDAATNLAALETMRKAFGLRVGYSDHTLGHTASLAATALGAVCIEKHLTLDRTMEGPDHAASSEPDELQALVSDIRRVEAQLGSPIKACMPEELGTAGVARKRIVAASSISEGTVFSDTNLTTKRAPKGHDPMRFWEIVGQTATRAYHEGEAID